MKRITWWLVTLLMMGATTATADQTHSNQGTKSQLSQIEARILALKNQLLHDQSEKDKLYKSLGKTEKEIGWNINKIHQIEQKKSEKAQDIEKITRNIATLNNTLKKQQRQLAHHIQTRHKLGAVHPWQYLLSQNTIAERSRLFIWYQYLFQADQKLITKIQNTTHELSIDQTEQQKEKASLSQLQSKLKLHQQELVALKTKQQHLINALNQKIQTKNQQLVNYRDDKIRLQQLLNTLNQQTQTKARANETKGSAKNGSSKNLHLGRASLSNPLKNNAQKTKALNQGIVFLAKEGTPVRSVLPGKVVFSDWLRGYGLLLIIDHGDGLMSLYAHNASLFASVGINVNQDEQIATIGHTGGIRENGLYFELRKRGRAIPPREWMS